MEKTETRDFMKVESFSQLPFIRPAPFKEKGIRLFGKEVGGGDNSNNNDDDRSESAQTTAINPHHLQESNKDVNNHRGNESNGESTRKFGCHYCGSNFPTSQALGGHQNAHKRERQQAKRAHLQAAMVQGGLAEAHVYGLTNYHRLGSVPTPHHHTPLAYHSWPAKTYHNSYTNNSRIFCGGGGGSFSHQPPINGSPLGLWRIPTPSPLGSSSRDDSSSMHHHPLPLFASEDLMKSTLQHQREVVMSSNSQAKLRYETKSKLQDHVSLDLHL